MIAIIPNDKAFVFKTNDNNEIIIPDNLVDLQNFIDTLWDKISNENEILKIELYNKAAKIYNEKAKFQAITIIHNFKQQKMATTKKAAKKTAPKKAVPNLKKITTLPEKETPVKEKKPSQKDQIVLLADEGKTIDEIAEATGIKKTNVSWYFSKLKLSKK